MKKKIALLHCPRNVTTLKVEGVEFRLGLNLTHCYLEKEKPFCNREKRLLTSGSLLLFRIVYMSYYNSTYTVVQNTPMFFASTPSWHRRDSSDSSHIKKVSFLSHSCNVFHTTLFFLKMNTTSHKLAVFVPAQIYLFICPRLKANSCNLLQVQIDWKNAISCIT